MKVNYNYKYIDERLAKSRRDDFKKLLACKAIVKTDEGYAIKITGNVYDINNHARQPSDKFAIMYQKNKGDRAGIDWDAKTCEFFVYIRYKDEFFSRYVSIGFYPELSHILDELMVPLHGHWDWEYGENKLTVTKKIKSNNLLGSLIGSDTGFKRKINFRDYVRVLDARVDSIVRIIGRDKIWVTWA